VSDNISFLNIRELNFYNLRFIIDETFFV
jgi:hypothetical protein